jgi:CMP-N,N'-diacetyllegionaminic acid synthase
METLFVIPARGGSKGVPGKNIKPLNGKPLIHYSIDYARLFAPDEDICVTTDSFQIAKCAAEIDYQTQFQRPANLATDTSGSHETLLHALHEYQKNGKEYDVIVLLQPTSPFRKKEHLEEALKCYSSELDMVVSVKEADANPYYNLFEENEDGFLKKSKKGNYERRQDCPKAFQYNGSIYIINCSSIREKNMSEFDRIVKYIMPAFYSVDIDSQFDWAFAEFISNKIE